MEIQFFKRGLLPILFATVFMIACNKDGQIENAPQISDDLNAAQTNNGKGHDYLLNLIGVSKDKTADMDNNSGHRIFVQLYGGEKATGGKWKEDTSWDDLDKVNKILLQEGDFQVLDANATDKDGALFQLPNPSTDGIAPTYTIKARALGKPGGSATLTTCAEESYDETTDIWCSNESVTIERPGKGGKPAVIDVTESLLQMNLSIDPDLDPELAGCLGLEDTDADDPVTDVSVWLFDDCFQNYFWNYDNNGLKLLQLRFYYEETM